MTGTNEKPTGDHVLRAMTDDGAFRVMTIRSTDTVRGAVKAQEVKGISAVQLGEMITSSVLVRETMAPAFRVQILLRDESGNRIVGDSFPEGLTRGLVQVNDEVLGVRLSDGGHVQVMRSLPGRAPHQGVVGFRPDQSVGSALATYFHQSEQIETATAVACTWKDGDVVAAGGYVVQLLPEITDPPFEAMRKRLGEFGDLEPHLVEYDSDPQRVLDELMGDTPYTSLADSTVEFGCMCGEEKALGAIATLGREEVQELLEAGDAIGVTCDYCGSRFEVGPAHFRRILEAESMQE